MDPIRKVEGICVGNGMEKNDKDDVKSEGILLLC